MAAWLAGELTPRGCVCACRGCSWIAEKLGPGTEAKTNPKKTPWAWLPLVNSIFTAFQEGERGPSSEHSQNGRPRTCPIKLGPQMAIPALWWQTRRNPVLHSHGTQEKSAPSQTWRRAHSAPRGSARLPRVFMVKGPRKSLPTAWKDRLSPNSSG